MRRWATRSGCQQGRRYGKALPAVGGNRAGLPTADYLLRWQAGRQCAGSPYRDPLPHRRRAPATPGAKAVWVALLALDAASRAIRPRRRPGCNAPLATAMSPLPPCSATFTRAPDGGRRIWNRPRNGIAAPPNWDIRARRISWRAILAGADRPDPREIVDWLKKAIERRRPTAWPDLRRLARDRHLALPPNLLRYL